MIDSNEIIEYIKVDIELEAWEADRNKNRYQDGYWFGVWSTCKKIVAAIEKLEKDNVITSILERLDRLEEEPQK